MQMRYNIYISERFKIRLAKKVRKKIGGSKTEVL